MGVFITSPFSLVSCISLNLSKSLPDFVPQKLQAFIIFSSGIFITNSFEELISSWLYLEGLMEIDIMGGLLQTVPAHASVIILSLTPFELETSTTGLGYNLSGF